MYPTLTETSPGFREILLGPGESSATLPARGARMPQFFSLPESSDPSSKLSRLRVACLGVGAVGRDHGGAFLLQTGEGGQIGVGDEWHGITRG